MNGLESTILELLAQRKENGAWQSEIESISGYSKSHLSETIKDMEMRGLLIKKREGNILNRVWSSLYFPGIVDGTVRAGILSSTEYLPALNTLEGICRSRKLTMKVRVYSSSIEMLESLYSGSIEIAMAPAVTQIIYASIRGKLNFISALASGGSGIYENKSSGSGSCSGSEISTMSLMTKKFLSEHRKISYIPYESMEHGIRDFLSGKVKYIAVWEPYCRLIEDAPNVRMVESYSDLLQDMPCCLMSCTDNSLPAYRDVFTELRRKYREFCDSPGDRLSGIEDRYGIFGAGLKEEVKHSLENYSFVSDISSGTVSRIAEENGILVPDEKMRHWMGEFLSPA